VRTTAHGPLRRASIGARRHVSCRDDRVAPPIEIDEAGRELGAQADAFAGDRIDNQPSHVDSSSGSAH
jgi:hypothetical protein